MEIQAVSLVPQLVKMGCEPISGPLHTAGSGGFGWFGAGHGVSCPANLGNSLVHPAVSRPGLPDGFSSGLICSFNWCLLEVYPCTNSEQADITNCTRTSEEDIAFIPSAVSPVS